MNWGGKIYSNQQLLRYKGGGEGDVLGDLKFVSLGSLRGRHKEELYWGI